MWGPRMTLRGEEFIRRAINVKDRQADGQTDKAMALRRDQAIVSDKKHMSGTIRDHTAKAPTINDNFLRTGRFQSVSYSHAL